MKEIHNISFLSPLEQKEKAIYGMLWKHVEAAHLPQPGGVMAQYWRSVIIGADS